LFTAVLLKLVPLFSNLHIFFSSFPGNKEIMGIVGNRYSWRRLNEGNRTIVSCSFQPIPFRKNPLDKLQFNNKVEKFVNTKIEQRRVKGGCNRRWLKDRGGLIYSTEGIL